MSLKEGLNQKGQKRSRKGRFRQSPWKNYRSDFQHDAEILTNTARNGEGADAEERTFLWISRCCGTWCLRERNVFLRGSMEYKIWRFYGEQDSDGILAYGIEVSGMRSGTVAGRLYELGKLISYTVVPNNQDQLTALLCQEHRDRERLGIGNIGKYLRKMQERQDIKEIYAG